MCADARGCFLCFWRPMFLMGTGPFKACFVAGPFFSPGWGGRGPLNQAARTPASCKLSLASEGLSVQDPWGLWPLVK